MRIAIVNDIVLAAEVLKRLVQSVPEYKVAWVAYDGNEAVQKCMADTPDLILMDLIMPNMGGTEATKTIMDRCPCAILIVTASVSGNISKVFEAMGHGALDVIAMPVYGRSVDNEGAQKLLHKISMMRRLIGVDTKLGKQPQQLPTVLSGAASSQPGYPLVLMGASTGGPLAISTILKHLPASFAAPIAIAQHVDGPFAGSLVQWLQQESNLPVKIAEEGDVPLPGKVYVAGTSDHMVLTKDRKIHYTAHPKDSVFRPSVDVLFESAALNWSAGGAGVILTGMGRDGAAGLLSLRNAGWSTFAQDEQSCVVYGMPKAAVELQSVSDILPLKEIPGRLSQAIEKLQIGV